MDIKSSSEKFRFFWWPCSQGPLILFPPQREGKDPGNEVANSVCKQFRSGDWSGERFGKVLSSMTIFTGNAWKERWSGEKNILFLNKNDLCEQGMIFFSIAFKISFIYFFIDPVPMPAYTRCRVPNFKPELSFQNMISVYAMLSSNRVSLLFFRAFSHEPTKKTKKNAKMIFKFCDEKSWAINFLEKCNLGLEAYV